jgi:hypothetical protein
MPLALYHAPADEPSSETQVFGLTFRDGEPVEVTDAYALERLAESPLFEVADDEPAPAVEPEPAAEPEPAPVAPVAPARPVLSLPDNPRPRRR